MKPKLLLDTHILLRWVHDSDRLSREQLRLLRNAYRNGEPVAISAISLLELAQLSYRGLVKFRPGVDAVFELIESSPSLRIFPLTIEFAREAAPLSAVLRDPADCLIVATARVHGLRLLTSDARIVDSKLAQVVTELCRRRPGLLCAGFFHPRRTAGESAQCHLNFQPAVAALLDEDEVIS